MSMKRGMVGSPRKGRLGGGPLCLDPGWLQGMQIIDGALRMRGSGEDQPLVVAQSLEPACDIGRVIVAHFRGDPEIGAEEGGTESGDQFFFRIAFIAGPHAPEIPCEALPMFRPVRDLMRECRR